ncbi:MAG TPA: XRE family transcriptional regulator [Aggregatilineales bacterium]|nr:XRE family transcriptional regulator [Aggregatilineales bacterium]
MSNADKILNSIDPRELGKRLRLARERRDMTQEAAAKAINVARTTIVAIEKGERRIRPDELVQLAIEYGKDVNALIQETKGPLFSEPQFRGPEQFESEDDEKIEQWIETLKELATDYFDYEQMLNAPMVRKYPAEYEVGRLKAEDIGESIALEERQRLGLGDKPIANLRMVLEEEVGLRIYYLPLKPSKYSAIYLYSDQIGGCIAVNVNHPEDRGRMSLAHDYGHFLTSRYKPKLYIEGYGYRSENEKIAEQFGVHFLMPTTGVTRRFNDIRKSKDTVTPYDLVAIAHYFGVSFEALCRRLEGLRLIPAGILDYLKEEGFKVREVQRQLKLEALPEQRQRLPLRHRLLAVEALSNGLISESRFAELLDVQDRLDARAIFVDSKDEMISF